jgi:tetratricopeptide (TPR) repeat protein
MYAYLNRAAAYIKLEKWNEAIKDLDMCIKMDPENGAAFLNRGIAREMIRDLQGACSDWGTAASLGIESGEVYYNGPACDEVKKYLEK